MGGDQPVLPVTGADLADRDGVAGLGGQGAEHLGLGEGTADARGEMGMAGQQRAVPPQQRDAARFVARDHGVEPLEIAQLDRAEDDAEELPIRGRDPAGDIDRPGAGAAIGHGFADEALRRVIGGQGAEIVPVRHIDGGDGPVAGEIDQPALGIDGRDGIELRQAADAAAHVVMHAHAGEMGAKPVRCADAGDAQPVEQGVLQLLDRIEGAVGLIGQDEGEALLLMQRIGQRARPQIQQQGQGAAGHGQRPRQAAGQQQLLPGRKAGLVRPAGARGWRWSGGHAAPRC